MFYSIWCTFIQQPAVPTFQLRRVGSEDDTMMPLLSGLESNYTTLHSGLKILKQLWAASTIKMWETHCSRIVTRQVLYFASKILIFWSRKNAVVQVYKLNRVWTLDVQVNKNKKLIDVHVDRIKSWCEGDRIKCWCEGG